MPPAPSLLTSVRAPLAAPFVAAIVMASQPLLAQAVPDTASARAESLFAAKDYVGAVSAFQVLTRTRPQQPRYWARLGTSLQLAGRTDDAVAAYRHAIGLGIAPVAMYNLATVFATRGQ